MMNLALMDVVTFVFVYVLVWWIVIFCVLPFGNKAHEEKGKGYAGSAPANPRIKQKLLWTSLIALLVTSTIYAVSYYTGFTVFNLVVPK
jgi:predicted secreted protein